MKKVHSINLHNLDNDTHYALMGKRLRAQVECTVRAKGSYRGVRTVTFVINP